MPLIPLPLQNEEAEELMRKVEKEEEVAASVNPGKQCFHLCIINLVIGTLYCAKVCVWGGRGGRRRGKQCFHLCIINLVIGTLYCAKVCVWEGGGEAAAARALSGVKYRYVRLN